MVVGLSIIGRPGSRMPVTSSASMSSRFSGASVGSAVNAQTVTSLAVSLFGNEATPCSVQP